MFMIETQSRIRDYFREDLLFPFLLLSLLLLDAINSLMEVKNWGGRKDDFVKSSCSISLYLKFQKKGKFTHQCGHDQKSLISPPNPAILHKHRIQSTL